VTGVRLGDGRAFVVKRSIPRLRVAAEWIAPVARAAMEVEWLRAARALDPRLAPEVIAVLSEQNLFVLPFLDPARHRVWKAQLAAERVDEAFAAQVGRDLAWLHRALPEAAGGAMRFAADAHFMALRIDPFLLEAARRNPDPATPLQALAADLQSRKTTIIHGDASPKNILMGPAGPVFLDAETACLGDPAFDLAFCSTHLLLKTVWRPRVRAALQRSLEALFEAYLADVAGEAPMDRSRRAAALTGALLLARVDGKSPAGYLDRAQDATVKARATRLLRDPPGDMAALLAYWRSLPDEDPTP
jgi:aminoglycoside phosphotransferase (APT) family kinase protein